MKEIVLMHGEICLVDDEDVKKVSGYNWFGFPVRGTREARAYLFLDGRRTLVRMHYLIMGVSEKVEHLNGNGLDNRKKNLRAVHPSVDRVSHHTGIAWDKASKKWRVDIYDPRTGLRRYLGLYVTEEEAVEAYEATRRELGPSPNSSGRRVG